VINEFSTESGLPCFSLVTAKNVVEVFHLAFTGRALAIVHGRIVAMSLLCCGKPFMQEFGDKSLTLLLLIVDCSCVTIPINMKNILSR
jgi:hypothetical protein